MRAWLYKIIPIPTLTVLLACLFMSPSSYLLADDQNGYTINYEGVSLVEYIKFISKITQNNFIFDEEELQNLTITVVSDEPITPENLMSTLIQSLRAHGLSLIEQKNSLLIKRNADVKQVATLIGENEAIDATAAIVTKVFRTHNSSVESIAAIVQSMISPEAILEVLTETRQIILTDITTNVEKIAALIENLDSPETPLEIEAYQVQHNRPDYLINLANQLMAPIAAGNPFILVPQAAANTVFIVSTPRLVEKSIAILTNLDTPPTEPVRQMQLIESDNIFIYKAKTRPAVDLEKSLKNIAKSLKESGQPEQDLIDTIETLKYIPETDSLLFTGTTPSLAKIKEFLETIDLTGQGVAGSATFFIYRPKFLNVQEAADSVEEYAKQLKASKLPDKELITSLESAKVVLSTQSILFTGNEATFTRLQEILANIDSPTDLSSSRKKTFYIYKVQHTSAEQLMDSLKTTARDLEKSKLPEDALIQLIQGMKYIADTNSILFTGTEEAIGKIQQILPTFDTSETHLPISNQFFVYKPQYLPAEELISSLNDMAKNFKDSNLSDPALLRTIESAKYVKATHSIIFTGDTDSLKSLEELIAKIDNPQQKRELQKTYFIYQLKFVSRERAEQYLKQIVQNLNRSGLKSEPVIVAIKSMRWIPESRSFMFSGTQETLDRLSELLSSFDVEAEGQKPLSTTYFLYKLQHAPGTLVENELEKFAKDLKSTDAGETNLIDVLENAKFIQETNSILLTGDANGIEEAKQIISKFDVSRDAQTGRGDFFMYKPKNVTTEYLEKSLEDVAQNLRKSNLSDPYLLNALKTMRYSKQTDSLIFTADPQTLKKVEEIVQSIDTESATAPIQQIGESTFLLVKLKHASGKQIQASIKQITKDLKRSGTTDKEFIDALESMKYVPETHSLLFTGTNESLQKIQSLVEKFDVTSLSIADTSEIDPHPGTFLVYKPKYLPGTEIEKHLEEFAENLRMSGLTDPELYHSLNNIRWIESTNSLIITGSSETLTKIKNIISEIDVPGKGAFPIDETRIHEAADSTSFLVYKLQYHKGEQIRAALRSVAKEMIENKSSMNKNLLEAINAIQWIEVTNSLLVSGNQETLTRLKELIKSLDIPLKQVFIEMLIIETSLANTLTFGLDWAGKGKFLDKATASMSNLNDASSSFAQNLDKISNTQSPLASDIPFGDGFNFGAIGDVIFHKGKSFISMGSLLKAIQSDNETTIITNPKLIAQDTKKSTIFIGQNIPFVGSFVQNTSQNTLETTNLEYRDVGVNLEITPVLGNSDVVTLNLALSRSATDSTGPTVSIGNVQGITTTRTSLDATVHVPNKSFLVLTGMVSKNKVRQRSGIPCLGGLPLIGAAFNLNTTTETDVNIVIFLKPHILSSFEDIKDISENQEDIFRETSGSPLLEQEFDEAMEMIKSFDDD